MGQLGFQELLVLGAIALLFFGPKKLPELGSGLGTAIRDFKNALRDTPEAEKEHAKVVEVPAALPSAAGVSSQDIPDVQNMNR